jgi:hypothetical protein
MRRPFPTNAKPRSARLLAIAVVQLLAFLLAPVAAGDFERPIPAGGGPTVIHSAMGVLDVDDINDASQNFTINLFALFQWDDPREAHSGKGKITKELGDVWHPHLFFSNMQRTWSSFGGDVVISPSGGVALRQQFWGDFSQPMFLHDFPFDEQKFEIRVVAAGPEEFEEIKFVQNPDIPSFVAETYSVADWKVLGSGVSMAPLIFPNGRSTDSYTFSFTAKRLSNHHLIKNIAPLLMIVILSWVVFWLDPKDGGTQLGVAVTSFLTMIAYHVALKSTLPEISYLTRLDVFVFGATLLVFFAMIEVVVTTGLARTDRVARARRLDLICIFAFPSALALIALYAFVWH